MSPTEREVVTPDRAIGRPDGERILAEVAAEYRVTVADIRDRRHRRYGPARITAARRLASLGWNSSRIGRMLRRTPSCVRWYLGAHTGKRPPAHSPDGFVLGPRQGRIYGAIGDDWMTSKMIAAAAGIVWVAHRSHGTGSVISLVCGELRDRGLLDKGGVPGHPLWRRTR